MRAQALHRNTGTWSIWQVVPLLVLVLQFTTARAYDWEIELYDGTAVAFDPDCLSSLALDSASCPHIGYHHERKRDLQYAYRSGLGHAGWHIETVDSAGMVGEFASLALDSSGRAHISYYDGSHGDLKYASRDVFGWRIETVDSTGIVGAYTSLALDAAECPHITYYDSTAGDLKYAYNLSGGWVIETVESEGDIGLYTSLALDSVGRPHVSYILNCFDYVYPCGDLMYAFRDASGWNTQTVDSADYGCSYTSLALDVSGHPHISAQVHDGRIMYTAMSESSGWTSEMVDWGAPNGYGPTSLALDEFGFPHIGYQWAPGAYPGPSRYACRDSIWHIDNVAGEERPSLALDPSGQPHMSFVGEYASAEVVGAEDGPTSSQPSVHRIDAVWPNPSRGVVYARVGLAECEAPGSFMIFDLLGRRLATLPLPGATRSGDAIVTLRLPDAVPSGQYFLTLEDDAQRQSSPVTIVR